jgi:type I restriction enzyme S subunit
MTKSSLHKGWRFVKFGDVVDNINESTRDPEAMGLYRVVGLDHMDSESLPLKRWDNLSDLHEGTSFTRIFRAGQVLFGKRRAYQRKVAIPDFDGICSGDILVFQPKNSELLADFLPYLVQSDGFFDHALGTSAGSLSPRTKWQELAKYEFFLPPIAEQQRIVSLISHLDSSVACENTALTSLDSSRLAIVNNVTEEAVQAGQMKSFGQVANWFAGGTPRASERSFYDGGTIPWATIGDISGRTISSTSSVITEDALIVIGGRLAPVGSILVSMYGTVGKAALVEKPMATNQAIAWAEPDRNQIIPEFLLAVIGLNEKKISELARGATQQNINRAILRSVEFGCPTLDSQIDAVNKFNSIEKVILNLKKNLNNKKILRSALLSNYQDVVSTNV